MRLRYVILVMITSLVLTFTCTTTRDPADPRLQQYLKVLRSYKDEIKNVGDVLEVLVRHYEQEEAVVGREVIGNIRYYVGSKLTGELDDVHLVLHPTSLKPIGIRVKEMKLWRNHKAARKKADEQLGRFYRNLSNKKITHFKYGGRNICIDFSPEVRLVTVGPRHSMDAGFDEEFDITTPEGNELYRIIVSER